MTNATKGKLLCWLAIALDVGVPLAVTLTQFPVWINRSTAATMSGLSLVLVIICCAPFFQQIKEHLKSPSIPLLWIVLFLVFVMLEAIASEIKIICFFGAIANCIGSVIYKHGKTLMEKTE